VPVHRCGHACVCGHVYVRICVEVYAYFLLLCVGLQVCMSGVDEDVYVYVSVYPYVVMWRWTCTFVYLCVCVYVYVEVDTFLVAHVMMMYV